MGIFFARRRRARRAWPWVRTTWSMQKEKYEAASARPDAKRGSKVALTLHGHVRTDRRRDRTERRDRCDRRQERGERAPSRRRSWRRVSTKCWSRTAATSALGERIVVKKGEQRMVRIATRSQAWRRCKVTAEDDKGNAVEGEVSADGSVLGKTPGTYKLPLCASELLVKLADGRTWKQAVSLKEREVQALRAVVAAPAAEVAQGKGGCPAGMAALPGGTYTMGDRKDSRHGEVVLARLHGGDGGRLRGVCRGRAVHGGRLGACLQLGASMVGRIIRSTAWTGIRRRPIAQRRANVCRRKRSGNGRREEPIGGRRIPGETMSHPASYVGRRAMAHARWAATRQPVTARTAFMTWQGMCGNGLRAIGPTMTPLAWSGAGAGAPQSRLLSCRVPQQVKALGARTTASVSVARGPSRKMSGMCFCITDDRKPFVLDP